ncbi:MAG: hypothetical protein R2882_11615 [Gemmatimonadales bacterium]
MRPLRYSINVSVDGCCDHRAMLAGEESHRRAVDNLNRADGVLFGRITYQLMEAWREPAETGVRPDWMTDWMMPFAHTIAATRKYVSSTLGALDWNAESSGVTSAPRCGSDNRAKGLLTGLACGSRWRSPSSG